MTEPQQKTLRLPRTQNGKHQPTFEANGTKYRILEVDSISIKKWNKFRRYFIMALSGMRGDGFNVFINNIEKSLNDFSRGQPSLGAVFAQIDTARKGMTELSEDRKDPVFSACACFIVPDGGDEVNWSDSVAEKSIEDWEEAGYTYPDFFTLLLKFQSALNEYLQIGILTDSTRITEATGIA